MNRTARSERENHRCKGELDQRDQTQKPTAQSEGFHRLGFNDPPEKLAHTLVPDLVRLQAQGSKQQSLLEQPPGPDRDDVERDAIDLFKNGPAQSFADVSVDASVVLGRWAWSSNFVDINNDGFDDIFVANGFVTNEDTGDL